MASFQTRKVSAVGSNSIATANRDSAQYNLNSRNQFERSAAAVEQNLWAKRLALASGFVVVCGIAVHASMQSDKVSKTGIVPMPTAKDPLNGYHAIVIFDYDDTKKAYLCPNSWGEEWGDKGWFWLPYDFKEIFDCWVPKVA